MSDRCKEFRQLLGGLEEEEVLRMVEGSLKEGFPPMEIIGCLTKGMEVVGKRFEEKEYFVADLMYAGEIMSQASALIEPFLSGERVGSGEPLVIGTVADDYHDVGKNILITLLKIAGFEVHDLGVDVHEDVFISKLEATGARILGLSSLLTTSRPQIKTILDALEKKGIRDRVSVMVGGAAVTQRFADEVGADEYAKTAMDAVKTCRILTE